MSNVIISGGPDAQRTFGACFVLHRYHKNRDLLEAHLAAMRAYFSFGPRKKKQKEPETLGEGELPMWLLVCPFVMDDKFQRERSRAAIKVYIEKCPLQNERFYWASRLGGEVKGVVAPAKALADATGRTAIEEAEAAEKAEIQRVKDEESAAMLAVNEEDAAVAAAAPELQKRIDAEMKADGFKMPEPDSDEAIAAEDAQQHAPAPETAPAREKGKKGKTVIDNQEPIQEEGVHVSENELKMLGLDKEFEGANT